MQKTKDRLVGSVAERIPPFAATCRVEPIAGVGGYSRCLVDVNIICGYRASPLNLGPFCLHPRRKEMIADTAGE